MGKGSLRQHREKKCKRRVISSGPPQIKKDRYSRAKERQRKQKGYWSV